MFKVISHQLDNRTIFKLNLDTQNCQYLFFLLSPPVCLSVCVSVCLSVWLVQNDHSCA